MQRLKAMLIKEYRQMFRDNSNIILGVVMPIVMIIIFGYGLSLDIKDVPVAVVATYSSQENDAIIHTLTGSKYFKTFIVYSQKEGEKLLDDGVVDAFIVLPANIKNDPEIQAIAKGIDANYARIIQNYIKSAISSTPLTEMEKPKISLSIRPWFNETQDSNYSIVTGLIVLIMTLIGALLTAMIMAKEWERGTLESLFATPVRIIEILLGKTIPYFTLGMVGFFLCLLAAKFLFGLPFVGSVLILILCSMLYLLAALGMGLAISSTVKSQFLASQIVLVSTFLPSLMLSGFIFDLTSAPLPIYIVAHIIPATWYVELLQTILLAGNINEIIIRNSAILIGYIIFFAILTMKVTRKSLD